MQLNRQALVKRVEEKDSWTVLEEERERADRKFFSRKDRKIG
jgi:hypothetical protein